MKTKKDKYEKRPLMERFADTCPDFQRQMHEIAKAGGRSIEYVFGLWDDYCATGKDQSKMVCEFKRWYAKELAPESADNGTTLPVSVPETTCAAKASHTPGPWHVTSRPDVHEHFIFGPEGTRRDITGLYSIAATAMDTGGKYEAENEANARLIAGAPELLDACKRAAAYLRRPVCERDGGSYEGTRLETAIAKAKGMAQ